MRKDNRYRHLPKGAFKLVYNGDFVGVRVEYRNRYYDIDIDAVSELFNYNRLRLTSLPTITLRKIGSILTSNDEVEGKYSCYDLSSFILKNKIVFRDVDLTNGKISAKFLDKILLVKELKSILEQKDGIRGSVMRTTNGRGYMFSHFEVFYGKKGYDMATHGYRVYNSEEGSYPIPPSRDKVIEPITWSMSDTVNLLDMESDSVFFNSLYPEMVCYNANRIETMVLRGEFVNGVLVFEMSPDDTSQLRHHNKPLLDFLNDFLLLFNDSLTHVNQHHAVLLDVSKQLLMQDDTQVQAL